MSLYTWLKISSFELCSWDIQDPLLVKSHIGFALVQFCTVIALINYRQNSLDANDIVGPTFSLVINANKSIYPRGYYTNACQPPSIQCNNIVTVQASKSSSSNVGVNSMTSNIAPSIRDGVARKL